MNREVLELLLQRTFPDATAGQRRVVARAAGDLADAGRYRADGGVELTPQAVVENLLDAPEDHGLVDRWNWWMGALEVAYGGYRTFEIRRWQDPTAG